MEVHTINETCKTSLGQDIYPCEEIYFKKNTNMPLRYFNVRSIAGYSLSTVFCIVIIHQLFPTFLLGAIYKQTVI